MRRTLRPLFLAAACLLLAAPSQAEARQPFRTYYPPRAVYTPPRPVYPGVYVFPQVRTPYYPALPYSGPGVYFPSWYGTYGYTPGVYRYWSNPWGSSFYYTNPSYYFWYRAW